MKETFRSLLHRNFAVYFAGYLPSVAGTFMQNLAMAWFIYRVTGSADLLVQAQFALLAPVAVLMLPAGLRIDLAPRAILLVTQTVELLQAVAVVYLAYAGRLDATSIMVLAAVAGACLAFEIPARGALIPLLVPPAEMANAYSLNSFVFSSGIASGRALAALLVAGFGEVGCFGFNAVSFIPEIIALAMLNPTPRAAPAPQNRSVADGLKFVWQNSTILRVVLMIAVFGLFGMQFQAILPIVAKETLWGGAQLLAVLLSAVGIGHVCGSIILSRKASKTFLSQRIGFVYVGLAAALALVAVSTNVIMSCIALAIVGVFTPMCVSGGHALAQLNATSEYRGRVSSIYFLAFLGSEPLGCLLAGTEVNGFGLTKTLIASAIACAVAGVIYLALKRPNSSEPATPIEK